MEITLLYHPYLVYGPKRYTVDGPISVKDFCNKFNITLKMLPRRNGVGNHTPLISINRESKNIDENSTITGDSTLSIMPNWLYGCGPAQTKEEFQGQLARLRARGMGIGGIPPFEETEGLNEIFEAGKFIYGDNKRVKDDSCSVL